MLAVAAILPGVSRPRITIPTPALDHDYTTGTLPTGITVTRTTTATRINSSGVIESVSAGTARLDYDPSNLAAGSALLIEGQRQNILLNSLIDGTNLSTQDVTVSAAAYTLSFYGTGTVTLSGTSTAGPLVGTGNYPNRVTLTFTPTAGTLTVTVSGDVKYAQLEAGSTASSFIPTAGTAVTRNADVLVMSGTDFSSWFNATEGTFYYQSKTGTNTLYAIAASDGTDNEYISSRAVAAEHLVVVDGAATQANLDAGTFTIGTYGKCAAAYKANDFAACINGGTVATDTAGTLPTVDRLYIGAAPNAVVAATTDIRLKTLRYYSTRLTNAQLQSVTA